MPGTILLIAAFMTDMLASASATCSVPSYAMKLIFGITRPPSSLKTHASSSLLQLQHVADIVLLDRRGAAENGHDQDVADMALHVEFLDIAIGAQDLLAGEHDLLRDRKSVV